MKKKKLVALIAVLLVAIVAALLLICFPFEKSYEGKIESLTGAQDVDFNVQTNSAVLIRKVEMVQWYKDEKGVRKVLSNMPIPSFSDNGTEYKNPSFPTDIISKTFFGTAKIGDTKLGDDILGILAYNGIEFKQITELDEDSANKYGMIHYEDGYVTSSNDWEIGDIRVTFYSLNDTNTYSITGTIVDGVLTFDEKTSIVKK